MVTDDPRFTRTHAAIATAFRELVLENGTRRITVRELADRAGVNRKTFYLHYPTIDDVYHEAIEKVLDNFFDDHETTPDVPEDIAGHAIRFFRFLAQQDEVTERLICQSVPFDFGRRLYLEQMNRYKAAGNPFGWLDDGRQDLVVHFIRATALDFYRRWVMSGKQVEPGEAANLLAELTCNGIGNLMRPDSV